MHYMEIIHSEEWHYSFKSENIQKEEIHVFKTLKRPILQHFLFEISEENAEVSFWCKVIQLSQPAIWRGWNTKGESIESWEMAIDTAS